MINCKHCLASFEPFRKTQIYCCADCRDKQKNPAKTLRQQAKRIANKKTDISWRCNNISKKGWLFLYDNIGTVQDKLFYFQRYLIAESEAI